MINFTGLRDAQIANKTSFLGVSVRVFPEQSRLCEKDHLASVSGCHLICWGSEEDKKLREGWIYSLASDEHPSPHALEKSLQHSWFLIFRHRWGLTPSAPLVLRHLDSDWVSWFSRLQTEAHGTSQPPLLLKSILINFSVSLSLSHWFCFSREL